MKLFISITFLMLITFKAYSKSELKTIKWKLHSDDEGIKIYTPLKYEHKSGLVPIKFKTTIKENIAKVVTVLADNVRKTQWLPYLQKSKTIHEYSNSDAVVYYRYGSPWPFSPRDFLIRSIAEFNSKTKKLWVEMKSIKKFKGVEKNDDYVRGFSHDGYAQVSYIDTNTTEIEMAFLNEFGGMIPTFVINIVQKKWPYEFMQNFRKQIAKPDITINPKFIID